MSSRRQKSTPLGGRCRQVSLYLQNVTLENILYIYLCFIFVFPCAVYCWLSTWYIDWLYQIARMEPFPITNKGSRSYGVWQYWMTNQYPVCIKMSATNTCALFVFFYNPTHISITAYMDRFVCSFVTNWARKYALECYYFLCNKFHRK